LPTNDTDIPNYGPQGLYDPAYPVGGPNPNDPYQCAFSLLNVGGNGTMLTGTLQKQNWSLGPDLSLRDGSPNVYELRLIDPATSEIVNSLTFTVGADASFSVGPVHAGTYNIWLRALSSYVSKFGLYQPNGEVISEQTEFSGFGEPFLGIALSNVAVSGTSTSLGDTELPCGDTDLSAGVTLTDLGWVLLRFGTDVTTAPVSEDFRYCGDTTGDGRCTLTDIGMVLLNFASFGPHW
jgi:hypothetical protein